VTVSRFFCSFSKDLSWILYSSSISLYSSTSSLYDCSPAAERSCFQTGVGSAALNWFADGVPRLARLDSVDSMAGSYAEICGSCGSAGFSTGVFVVSRLIRSYTFSDMHRALKA
jgi:hypothetical protein